MRQLTVWFSPCTSVPAVLVTEAYKRSVPTAVAGWIPKKSTKIGVINEPPPMPVCPTSRPTKKPETTNPALMVGNMPMRVLNSVTVPV
jgi:hypothetical protein